MKIAFQIEGAAELERNLATLPDRIARNVTRRAVREAQRIMLRAGQAGARSLPRAQQRLFARGEEDLSMSELMARSLTIAAPRRQIAHSYSLHVQFAKDVPEFLHTSKRTGRTTYIPAAIEYGHGATPEAAARPFMRQAAAGCQAQVIQKLSDELRIGLLRESIKGGSR